jgi:hypothetical protein
MEQDIKGVDFSLSNTKTLLSISEEATQLLSGLNIYRKNMVFILKLLRLC